MSIATYLSALPARYQGIAEQVYSDRCSVQRATQSDDGRGGWSETRAIIASGIPSAFVPRLTSQREVVIGDQLKGYADGDVWLPAQFDGVQLDVTEKDRMVMAANGTEPERVFEIVFPDPHQGILIKAAVRLLNAPYATNRQTQFSFDSESPLSLGTIATGKILRSVSAHIQEAFDDPAATLSVGDGGDPDSLMDEAMIVPSQVEMFRVLIGTAFGSDTELFLAISPGVSTQGSGYVELEFDA